MTLLVATASASLSDLLSFEFDKYFTRVESRPAKPTLGSYSYEFGQEFWDVVGYNLVGSGDINAEYRTPFTNNLERTFYTISFLPEVSFGGQQLISAYSPWFAFDVTVDLWPGTVQLFATSATFEPPIFNNFCWWSEWSTSLLELWVDVNISLWECETGLFDWIVQGNSYNCGLATYKFNTHAFELKYDAFDLGGEIVPYSCPWNHSEVPTEPVTPT